MSPKTHRRTLTERDWELFRSLLVDQGYLHHTPDDRYVITELGREYLRASPLALGDEKPESDAPQSILAMKSINRLVLTTTIILGAFVWNAIASTVALGMPSNQAAILAVVNIAVSGYVALKLIRRVHRA
jgi:hypothetical protein